MMDFDSHHGSATDPAILQVSDLNRLARSLLEDCFPLVAVEGEISNLSIPGSGHWYFTLKDDRAQVRCAMFRNRNLGVRFRPANGMQVIVRGKLSLYEGRGDYQLIVEQLQDAGAGALQKAFEALKAKLAEEGLFAAHRKQALPDPCRHVAVVTSPTGAVIRDIISVFQRRSPSMHITVLPVPVQGADAPQAIVRALQTADRRAAQLGFDAIILARGGGSLEDLQAFNDERVARAISATALPVVSAVGHETDVSIADFVADVRAPTPSAAAELLSTDQQALANQLSSLQMRLQRLAETNLRQHAQRLHSLRQRLRHPGRRLQEQAQQLDNQEQRLLRAINYFIGYRQQSLKMLARQLDSVSPLQTLQRGYSITTEDGGHVITDSRQLQPGQRIVTRLAQGSVRSVVSDIDLNTESQQR